MLVEHLLRILKALNELDKACFSYDAACSDIANLAKKTVSDSILKDRSYENARSPKHHGSQRAFASMVNKFCDKTRRSGARVNEELSKELYKPVRKK